MLSIKVYLQVITMIKAYEAKQLSEDSQLEVDKVLTEIDSLIREAAIEGKRTISFTNGRCSWRDDSYESSQRNIPFVNRVIKKLRENGYMADYANSSPYKVGCDEESHYNVYLSISW